ncbi:XdhC family protein [Catenuloplanes atrovinosus]|uniref:Xanthine dehydrogenase accessory factor n=1 Tax=Catenuloplanes atrovinosus TaxID=137266 RepID=A0AAE3YIG3_9ACTN|nr:XdhC family protein [Catenuloplanes atrovinosus]MDR7274309.1 xanthine dehydrogenase accessory factor [Catenuloplanes atrovinosus]
MLVEVWPFVVRARARGVPVVLVRLVGRDGRGSRPLGATMAVAGDGSWCGSISGGCVEGIVLDEARTVLAGGGPRLLAVDPGAHLMPWEAAPACGGILSVLIVPAPPSPVHDEITTALAAGPPITVSVETAAPWRWRTGPARSGPATPGPATGAGPAASGSATGSGPAAPELADRHAASTTGSGPAAPGITGPHAGSATGAGPAAPDHPVITAPMFAEQLRPGPRLVVVGATDLGAALATLGRAVGRRVEIVDPRESHALPDGFPGASRVERAWPDAWLAAHPPSPADAVVAITHDPRIDDRALRAALGGRTGYVGALGSRETHRARLARLAGTPGLDRLAGPAGLDLGATSIAETALSILAEIIATAHDRDGGHLATRTTPIRAAPALTEPPLTGALLPGGAALAAACAL